MELTAHRALRHIEPELDCLRAASNELLNARRAFVDAVLAARAAGHSWSNIGLTLNMPADRAREVFENCNRGLPARL